LARGAQSQDLAERQSALNAGVWTRGEFLDEYTSRRLRPVEAVLLDRYREDLHGRVLELGCGAGRLTGHLLERSTSVSALDLSPAMIAYCRRVYRQAEFEVGDLRNLSRFENGSFEAVVAAFNVLDVVDDRERRGILTEIGRVLLPGGLLIMSSHNLAYAPLIEGPLRLHAESLWGLAHSIKSLPRRVRNRRRLRPLQRVESGYAILNDEAHDFALLHYYTTRDAQDRQLEEEGFELLECLDLNGRSVATGELAAQCPELHYVARVGPSA
jgi:SAM-dependent methyltransferase